MYLQVVLTFVLTFVYKLLQVGARCLCVTICLQVVTRVYNVLQVHVLPRSEVTFGNDVIHHNTTSTTSAKTGLKMISYTTHPLPPKTSAKMLNLWTRYGIEEADESA